MENAGPFMPGQGQGPWLAPWEDHSRGFFSRLGDTVMEALLNPEESFGRITDGAAMPGLSFAAVVSGMTQGLLSFICGPCIAIGAFVAAFADGVTGMMGMLLAIAVFFGLPLGAALLTALNVVISGLIFHGTARLFGGRGSLEGSIRAMGYAEVVQPAYLALTVVANAVPFVGPSAVGLIRFAFHTYALYLAARSFHHLDGWGGLIAALAPALIAMIVMVGGMLAMFAGILAIVSMGAAGGM